MRHILPALTIASLLAVSGCGNEAATPDNAAGDTATEAPSGLLGAAANKAKAESAAAALPKPDRSKPLYDYPELEDGNRIMFLYFASSELPPDYAELASSYSREYRTTEDTFRKNDLLQVLKPKLELEISQAEADPYGWMEIEDPGLGAYDFDRKGFPVGEFADERVRYFNDNSSYRIGWANYEQVAFAPVADEATARQIESMRNDWNNRPRLKVYFFAQSADLNEQKVNALVTHVQVTDQAGRVLAEYGADGSVPRALASAAAMGN